MSDVLKDFDINDPILPKAIKKAAMASGDFPYEDKLDEETYNAQLLALHLQLARLQEEFVRRGDRMVLVFEGRDAAGKGGAIRAYSEHVNPRFNIVAALPKPSDRQATQWYFQRYIDYMPAKSETVLFDRSWYNRAGVEPVMGFCTPAQTDKFLDEVQPFEKMLIKDDIHLFKFWLDIGREMQVKRFHDRRHDPLNSWKLGPVDLKALDNWEAYSDARDRMLRETDHTATPWTVILANDKKRTRLAVLQTVLGAIDYEGKDDKAVGKPDERIVFDAKGFLARPRDARA